MSEATKIWLLLRRGILPQEHEAEVAEYVQSRVQDLALEIAGRFQITERDAEQKIRESLPAANPQIVTTTRPQATPAPGPRDILT
jgi:hypothetical protein